MNDERIAIFLSSNEAGATRKIELSRANIKTFLLAMFISFIVFICAVFDYAGLVIQEKDRRQTRIENSRLNNQLQFVRSELSTLQSQLKTMNKFADRIEVIQNYFQQGPLSTVVTPTEYFTVDYVASSAINPTNDNELNSKKVFILKEGQPIVSPFIENSRPQEKFVIDELSEEIDLAVRDTQVVERRVMQSWENLSERQNFLRATPSIKPAKGWFSSRFGIRADPFTGRPTMHSGLDIAARWGTPVYATADGVVTYVGFQSGYGNVVSIDHGYGIQTRYAHNARITVKVGQQVQRYDTVAAIGNSGRSTGPHLHYEVRVRGVAVDPSNYILDF